MVALTFAVRVLITGGAGFIGSHLTDHLLERGYHVRILDNLLGQVHLGRAWPQYVSREAELIKGDVRNRRTLRRALAGIDAVVHLAARVGVGQSMYEIGEYTSTNSLGTAVLLDELARRPVDRLVVASSMSIYGEGLYRTEHGERIDSAQRALSDLQQASWEPQDKSGRPLHPIATPESKPPVLSSVYALSKFEQERASLLVGGAYRMPTVALRFFNTYGTRQALSNPYTGVLAIFGSRLLNRRPPLVFEDGRQLRDFVHVRDVARACRLALERPAEAVAGQAFNVGSGQAHTVADVSHLLADALDIDIAPQLTGRYRIGDIRHCFADLTQARARLGFTPTMTLREGVVELCEWLLEQTADDRVERASAELAARGLTV